MAWVGWGLLLVLWRGGGAMRRELASGVAGGAGGGVMAGFVKGLDVPRGIVRRIYIEDGGVTFFYLAFSPALPEEAQWEWVEDPDGAHVFDEYQEAEQACVILAANGEEMLTAIVYDESRSGAMAKVVRDRRVYDPALVNRDAAGGGDGGGDRGGALNGAVAPGNAFLCET